MKYLFYVHVFFSALALLNAIKLEIAIGKIYKRKVELNFIEKVISLIITVMYCFIPVFNIVLAFLSEETFLRKIKESDTFEKR